jgi:hypothetical protein
MSALLEITVKDKIKQLEKAFGHLGDDVDRKIAYARAINRVVSWASTRTARHIAKVNQVKYADVKKDQEIIKANSGNLTARLRVNGRYDTLYKYGMRNGGVVQTRSMPGAIAGIWGMHRHAFVATMENGHTGIFIRRKKPGPKGGKLRELYGPVTPRPLMDKNKTEVSPFVEQIMIEAIEIKFTPRAMHELRRRMIRVGKIYGVA